MEDLSALLEYFKKIQRALNNADFNLFGYKFVKKNRMDDLLVCTLALLPESFKNAAKRKTDLDNFPSVACYTRLSKLLKKQIGLFPDYYIVQYNSASAMLKSITKNINLDIKKLESM